MSNTNQLNKLPYLLRFCLLAIAICTVSQVVSAQEYKKMFTDGKKWVYKETMFSGSENRSQDQSWVKEVVGDTV